MNTDTLEFPTVEIVPMPVAAPAAPAALDMEKLDLTALAVAKFGDWRGGVAKARKTLTGAVHDLTTQAKVDEAKSLRFRLIGQPRADVRKVSKGLKSKLATVSKAVGAEEDAAVAAFDDAETLITPQIEAREAEIAAEKAERERIEAERRQKQADGIATIRSFLARAQAAADMTVARIDKGIAALEAQAYTADGWLDPVAAANAQCETLEGMLQLRAVLEAREAEAARLEAQRLENERIAREQAERQAELDRQAAEVRASQQRIAGLQARVAEIRAAAAGHDKASAADLLEARTAVAALDVSEANYAEFAALAQAEKATTLAVLDKLHGEAVSVEAKRAAALQEVTEAANAMARQYSQIASVQAEMRTALAGAAEVERVSATPAAAGVTPASDPAFPGTDDHRTIADVDAHIKEANASVPPLAALLAHLHHGIDTDRFPSHPKPTRGWWDDLKALMATIEAKG